MVTVNEILHLIENKEYDSSVLLSQSTEKIFQFRAELEKNIQEGERRYVCKYCKQFLKIRGKRNGDIIMHFAHLKDSEDCHIKSDTKFTKSEIEAIKYNGAKESELHIKLKEYIFNFLEKNKQHEKGITFVDKEKIKRDSQTTSKWKRPDISAVFLEKEISIELQLSTTFLSVVISRQLFYKQNRTFILWVFSKFETIEERQKFTQSDIFYSNNLNGFTIDSKSIELSNSNHDLYLCCHFKRLSISGDYIIEKWDQEYVTLADLKFDLNNYQIYYYDTTNIRLQLENDLKLNKSKLLKLVKFGDNIKLENYFDNGFATKEEINELKIWFTKSVRNIDHVPLESFEYRVIYSIVLHKLKEMGYLNLYKNNYNSQKALFAILSLKMNKIIGKDFKTQIQIAHNFLDNCENYKNYYILALERYDEQKCILGNQKFKMKIDRIKSKNIEQVKKDEIIDNFFPEIKS